MPNMLLDAAGRQSLMGEFLRTHRYRLLAIGLNWAEAIEGIIGRVG
jgi:hypothetical protein